MKALNHWVGLLTGSALIAAALVGCDSPLGERDVNQLREQVIAHARQSVNDRDNAATITQVPADQQYTPEIRRELDLASDPRRHADTPGQPGPGLDQSEPEYVRMTLAQALVTAAGHNLDVRLAQVIPQIRQTQVTEAEADFDLTAFANTSMGHTDQPLPTSQIDGSVPGANATTRDTSRLEAGLRQRIQLGGTVTLSTGAGYINDMTPRTRYSPDPSWTNDVALALTQPLLRDFGEQVNGAKIKLAENARRRDVLAVKQELLRVIGETEQAYWELVFARYRLSIQEQLLAETVRTRDEVTHRGEVDANPVQLAQAESEVNVRQAELFRARADLRKASDKLKRLLNAPSLPLSGEMIVQPVDYPDELPVPFKLSNAIATAIHERPELSQILLQLADAKIQQDVAENQTLPRLDLKGQVRHYGLDGDVAGGYRQMDGDYYEYLVGLEFEQPIGNRAAEAAYLRTRLTEQAQNIRYCNQAQDVVLSVKDSLRDMQAAYQVLGVARQARRAAAENLRALREREKTGQQLTPEFLLDLKLRTQQRLAQAETDEVRAEADANITRMKYHQAMGTLLDERGIELEPPEAAKSQQHESDTSATRPQAVTHRSPITPASVAPAAGSAPAPGSETPRYIPHGDAAP
ncbi:MAG: TolC family protein [Phycisphaerales bacterium]